MAYYKPQNLPAVDKIFKNLAKGQTPNFLEIMSAISDIAEASYSTDLHTPHSTGAIKKSCRVSIYPLNAPGLSCQNCG